VNRTVTGARSNAVRGVDRAAILAEQRSNSSRIRRACNRTHAPTAWPATRSPATPYTGPQHDPGAMVASVRDACFESISRPANARRELQPVRPTAPPLDTAENACQSRDGRDNHGERKSIHAGGCTRLRKQWPERGPHAKKVSSGPHAGEGFVRTPRWIGFVRTPCWRGFRQDPMHDSKCGALNKQAAVEWRHGLKAAHARRRGCTPGRAPW